MLYSFNDADAPTSGTKTQYFEMFCNRGIYHKGWSAVTQAPHAVADGRHEDAGVRRRRVGAIRRQLADWTQANDLAKEMPEKLT